MYYIVGMAEKDAALGEFEQVVLLAILRLGNAAYGVSIRSEIEVCARRGVSPGALYTTLERLEGKGLVVGRAGEPTPERGGRAKRFYTVTKAGRSRLAAAQRAFRSLLAGLDLLGEGHG